MNKEIITQTVAEAKRLIQLKIKKTARNANGFFALEGKNSMEYCLDCHQLHRYNRRLQLLEMYETAFGSLSNSYLQQ